MINKSFKERMELAMQSNSWHGANKDDLVRVKREYKDSWEKSLRFYMPFAKDLKFEYTSESLKKFFSNFIGNEVYCKIEREGQITVLVDEAIFRRSPQLEFDFNSSEKVTA